MFYGTLQCPTVPYSALQFLVVNDFPLINESISKRVEQNVINANDIDSKLVNLKNEIGLELYELEDEYYHSLIK